MMICQVCGRVNAPGAHRCDVCGSPVQGTPWETMSPVWPAQDVPVCPVCRRANRKGSAFCAYCGYRLVGRVAEAHPYAAAPAMPVIASPPGVPEPVQAPAYVPPPSSSSLPSPPAGSAAVPDIEAGVTGNIPSGALLKRRYRILRKIAQGGMGAVYESTDLLATPGTRRAVKEISPAALPPSERGPAIADFRREAQMLATLQHPNLPTVVETFEELGKHFLVMEFIPGRTLLNVLDSTQGFLDEERVLVWAWQLLDVLHYLHSQDPPIIYRDLKPANVMLVEGTERIKLIDFGIARFHKAGKARDTEAFGTAGYAPPEQYGKGQTDQRSDVYALAATLHHLLSRHDPSHNPFTWLPVRRYNPAVSVRMEGALQRALNLDPAKRFQTVKEFAEALGLTLTDYRRQTVPALATSQPAFAEVAPAMPAPAAPTSSASAPSIPAPTPPPAHVMPGSNGAGAKSPARKKTRQASAVPVGAPLSGNGSAPLEVASAHEIAPVPASMPASDKDTGQVPAPAPELVISDRLVDLGDVRWNSRAAARLLIRSANDGPVRGTVLATHPWIAYNPRHFQGKIVNLEVKVRKSKLQFGRVELQVPNVFAIIWSRLRRMLPLIGFWFWLLLLTASSLGRWLIWAVIIALGGLVVFEGLMWLWAWHVRMLVPADRLNTGQLVVKSRAGAQHIEVRAMARPSWLRRAAGWALALALFTAEVAVAMWIVLSLAGVNIQMPLSALYVV